MVAEADIVCHQSIQVLDVQYRCIAKPNIQKIEDIVEISSTSSSVFQQIRASVSIPTEISRPEVDLKSTDTISDGAVESAMMKFVPTIRSGSFADIGKRRFMEDEHIRIDDLSSHLGSLFKCPTATPSAFYGVFDGHGGPEAAAYMKKNAFRFFFEDADFPQSYVGDDDDTFLEELENSFRKAFLQVDLALADDCSVSSSAGTTAVTALILGRLLLVANAGDCRAVLCRKGKAIEMSQDHKPIYPSERIRIEQSGGYVEDGYLNGVLSVSRALGDWDMKSPKGSASPLIAEPEFRDILLTEDDEFLIIGCDGIWDVMSSQDAVGIVRRGLRRHDDPEQCAKDLVKEALWLKTSDNLSVVVVCFMPPTAKRRCCGFSAEALRNLKRLLDGGDSC